MHASVLLCLTLCVASWQCTLGESPENCNDEENQVLSCIRSVQSTDEPNTRYVRSCGMNVIYQCDGETLRLDCGINQRVQVLDVYYGRYEIDVCLGKDINSVERCQEQSTNARIKQLVEDRCRDRHSQRCADLVVGDDFESVLGHDGLNLTQFHDCLLSSSRASSVRSEGRCRFALVVEYSCIAPTSSAPSSSSSTLGNHNHSQT